MNLIKFVSPLLLILFLQVSLDAQDWVSYQSQQKINDLVDTGNELLMATDIGLVVMDKTTLQKTIFTKDNSNLTNNHIQSITQSTSGDTWIGTYDLRLAMFDGSDFQNITTPTQGVAYNPANTELYDFEIAPNGDFWLGTSKGVIRREGQNWTHFNEVEMGSSFFKAWDVMIDDGGKVFVGSFDVHTFENDTWSNITENAGINGYLDADFFMSSSGDIFFAGDLDSIGRFDGNTWQGYEHNLNGSHIKGFTEDTNGDIYFHSLYDGIYKLQNDTWVQQIDAQTTAFNNNTSLFYIDDQGNRWLNNNIHLSVNSNGNIQSTLISEHTIESNTIYSIDNGGNGSMYFVTSSTDNISVVDSDGNWSFLPYPNSTSMIFIKDILYIDDNDIWMTTYNGIYHYTGVDWDYMDEEGYSSGIVADSQGKVYVLTNTRIIVIENNMVSEFNNINSPINSEHITGIGVDPNDNLWIAEGDLWDPNSESFIHTMSITGTWNTFSETDYPMINEIVGEFHFDVNGNVWIPNRFMGAIKYDGQDWTNPFIGNEDQIVNTRVFSIDSDANGIVYFSHHYGVTTNDNNVWGNLMIDEISNFDSQSSLIKFDDQGTLWWGSARYGIFSYTPDNTTSIYSDVPVTSHFSIYPNPADEYTVLEFEMEYEGNVNATIYNNLGQLITKKDFGKLNQGNYQETFNVSHLPKGFYMMVLQIDEKSSTRKLVIN